jgi:hypothetical protein
MNILKRDGREGYLAHRKALGDEFERRRIAAEEQAAAAEAATRGPTSEETEALAKARYAAAQEMRRQRAEEIAALRDLGSQAQGIADTAAQVRDSALAARDLETAIAAQVRVIAAASLPAIVDEDVRRKFPPVGLHF